MNNHIEHNSYPCIYYNRYISKQYILDKTLTLIRVPMQQYKKIGMTSLLFTFIRENSNTELTYHVYGRNFF